MVDDPQSTTPGRAGPGDHAVVTHMFWAYGSLSNLEKICINSFRALGYELNLWTYGDIPNAPAGTMLRDARELLPEHRVFTYEGGSYAGFANLFRYVLLSRLGGLYADTDVIAITPAGQLDREPFLVAERVLQTQPIGWRRWVRRLRGRRPPERVNNNVIHSARPRPGDIMDLAWAFSDRFPVEGIQWGDTGPHLINTIAHHYPRLAFPIKPPEFANPFDWWRCPEELLKPGGTLPSGTAFLHCFNETWRRAGIDKNASYPKGSLMERMAERYL